MYVSLYSFILILHFNVIDNWQDTIVDCSTNVPIKALMYCIDIQLNIYFESR